MVSDVWLVNAGNPKSRLWHLLGCAAGDISQGDHHGYKFITVETMKYGVISTSNLENHG